MWSWEDGNLYSVDERKLMNSLVKTPMRNIRSAQCYVARLL